ncbi:MAG: hypothetical protein Q9183_001344, partial [Haloplaca sp. 2 TL-2023]
MPKGRKAKKAPPPSDTSSSSEESASPPPTPRRRQTVPRRANASFSKGKGPTRRASMPGEAPSDSDDEPPRKSTARGKRPIKNKRPASSDEEEDDEDGEENQRPRRPQPKKGSRREGRDGRAAAISRPKKPVQDSASDDDDDDPRCPPRRTNVKGKAPARDDDDEDSDDDPAPAPRRKVTKGKAPLADDGSDDDDEPKSALRRKAPLGGAPGADVDERPRSSSSRRRQTTSSSHREPSAVGIHPATHAGTPNEHGEMDEDFLKALALSQRDHQPAQSPVVDDFEEQLRRAIEESQQVEESRTPAPAYVDDDQAFRHWLEVSEQEHQAQIRKRQDQEEEEERKFQAQLNAVIRASESTVPAPYLAAERELENVRQSSHETHSEDVQRAAQQMVQERTTTQRSASWTETGMAAFQRGESSSNASPTPAPAAETPNSTARTPQRKKSVMQRIKTSVSGSKKKPRRSSNLVTIPERAASAGPSTPSPLRTITN